MKTDSTYHLSIQQRSRASIRINLPIDAAEIERVVLNGITFGLRSVYSGSTNKRVILSAYKREKLCQEIDRRFREMMEAAPRPDKRDVYNHISEHSVEWLGVFLGPRQVEGKHATFEKSLRNRRGKDKRF